MGIVNSGDSQLVILPLSNPRSMTTTLTGAEPLKHCARRANTTITTIIDDITIILLADRMVLSVIQDFFL